MFRVQAEVQALHHDGVVMLHTRSQKYGKLHGGQLLTVHSDLIKRQKRHFQSLHGAGVDVILGCNGFVWIMPGKADGPQNSSLNSPLCESGALKQENVAR